MTDPGEGVTGNEREREQPPLSNTNQRDRGSERSKRAEAVKQTGSWFTVLTQVERPEFSKRFELTVRHFGSAF